jgi:hypothetical protein
MLLDRNDTSPAQRRRGQPLLATRARELALSKEEAGNMTTQNVTMCLSGAPLRVSGDWWRGWCGLGATQRRD